MSADTTALRIRTFLVDHFPSARGRSLQDDDGLLENGIVDSLGVLDLVAYLEREFEIKIPDDELLPEHFATIACLTTFVNAKRGQIA